MFQCPNCSNTLSDNIVRCQFCGADVSKVLRPPTPTKVSRPYPGPAKWIWPTYYIVSAYWILSGAFDAVRALGVFGASKEVDGFMLVIGSLNVAIGLGLVFRVELIRGFINVICWLQIAVSVLGAITSLFLVAFVGPIAFLFVFLHLLDIATAGLLIYLVGETD